jgi:DNA invertase Pin-like site-specific DNA recombinase
MVVAIEAQHVRALLYDRVSTMNQARSGYSGGADGFQIERCRAYADARGWACVGTLTDVDSGAEWEIDGIMEALERAKRREYDVLVVSDTSRFARDAVKKIVYERDLEKRGVRVVYTNLPDLPDDNTPDTRLTNNIMRGVYGAMDEYERDKIAWRTKHGRRKKAETGKVVGGGPAPYGYEYVTIWDDTKKKQVPITIAPHVVTADIVRRLYRDIVFASAIELARTLTAEGVPTPTGKGYEPAPPKNGKVVLSRSGKPKRAFTGTNAQWGNSTIRTILMNSVYKGEWRFTDIGVAVPALVDSETWERAQQLLRERAAGRTRRARRAEQDDAYELRGLLTCGHCDGAISTSTNSVGAGYPRQRVYVCLRHQPRRARDAGWDVCELPMFMASVEGSRQRDYVGIEDHAWQLVSSVLLDPQRLQAELDRLNDLHAEARAEHAGRLQTLDAEITKHERTLRRASEEKLNIDADDVRYTIYAEAEQRAADMLKRLQAERKAFAEQPVPGMSDDEAQEVARATREIRVGIEHADAAARRRLYKILRLRGRVYRDAKHGMRIGYRGRFRVEWDSVIPLNTAHGVFTSSM